MLCDDSESLWATLEELLALDHECEYVPLQVLEIDLTCLLQQLIIKQSGFVDWRNNREHLYKLQIKDRVKYKVFLSRQLQQKGVPD